MNFYEIHRIDEPAAVAARHWASSPEKALEIAAQRRPGCIYDTAILTLIDENGAYGPRRVDSAFSDG